MAEQLTALQERAISRIAEVVTDNIVSANPVASLGECDKLLSSKKFDYSGRPLRTWRTWSALGYCRVGQRRVRQPIENFLSDHTKAVFEHPDKLLLAPELMPRNALRSKVRAKMMSGTA